MPNKPAKDKLEEILIKIGAFVVPANLDEPVYASPEAKALITQLLLEARIDEVWKAYVNHSPTTKHKDFLKYLNGRIAELTKGSDLPTGGVPSQTEDTLRRNNRGHSKH
jgi:hypothetical protein